MLVTSPSPANSSFAVSVAPPCRLAAMAADELAAVHVWFNQLHQSMRELE
jgi:hypothetical protein